jgi:hypothetical protein
MALTTIEIDGHGVPEEIPFDNSTWAPAAVYAKGPDLQLRYNFPNGATKSPRCYKFFYILIHLRTIGTASAYSKEDFSLSFQRCLKCRVDRRS